MPALVLITVTAAALALTTTTSPVHAAARSCGTIVTDGAAVHVKAIRGARCTTARRVLRRYLTSSRPCNGSACLRRHLGWTCATAAAYASPRLASCSRRGQAIAAYAFAD